MNDFKFEYMWLDGYIPVANLRSRTMVFETASITDDSFGVSDRGPLFGFQAIHPNTIGRAMLKIEGRLQMRTPIV